MLTRRDAIKLLGSAAATVAAPYDAFAEPAVYEHLAKRAVAYRRRAVSESHAVLHVRYGAGPLQTMDIFKPRVPPIRGFALFFPGGGWRQLGPSYYSHLAAGLNAHGVAVAVCGYDLCPDVTIRQIINQGRAAVIFLSKRYGGRKVFVFGHSAGGHLAACMLGTNWQQIDATMPADLVPSAAGISGLYDLRRLVGDPAYADLRLNSMEDARRVSPIFWNGRRDRTFQTFVGSLESDEFRYNAHSIAKLWKEDGTQTRATVIPGVNHFSICDLPAQPQTALTGRLVTLAIG